MCILCFPTLQIQRCMTCPWTSWPLAFVWLMRPVAIAGASGGFASLALGLLKEAVLQGGVPEPFNCPLCPSSDLFLQPRELDLYSLSVGILVGLSIGPLIDFAFVARQSWTLRLRRWLHRPLVRQQVRVLA